MGSLFCILPKICDQSPSVWRERRGANSSASTWRTTPAQTQYLGVRGSVVAAPQAGKEPEQGLWAIGSNCLILVAAETKNPPRPFPPSIQLSHKKNESIQACHAFRLIQCHLPPARLLELHGYLQTGNRNGGQRRARSAVTDCW